MRLARWLTAGFALLVVLMLVWSAAVVPDRTVAELAPRWAPPPSTFRPVAGLHVHLRDEGPRTDSVPIVLLHGTSASLHTWDGWATSLRGTRRVIRPDLPGFGLTGPFLTDDYRIARYTEFVVALLDSLQVPRADFAGNSLGGEIAWEVAARAPARVRRLVLIDPAGFPFESASIPLGFRLAREPALSWITTRLLPRSVVETSVRDVYGDPSRVSDSLVERYYELARREGNRRVLPLRFAQAAPGADTAILAAITAPTLIMWGGRDRLIPPSTAARFRRQLPAASLIVYPDLGHVPHEEDAPRTVRDAAAFLGRPQRGGG